MGTVYPNIDVTLPRVFCQNLMFMFEQHYFSEASLSIKAAQLDENRMRVSLCRKLLKCFYAVALGSIFGQSISEIAFSCNLTDHY